MAIDMKKWLKRCIMSMNFFVSFFRRQSSILWIAVFGLIGCGSDSSPVTPETLTFADPTQAMISLMYVAEERGYFAEENLRIQYVPVTSGRDALKKLLAGEVDLGAATEFPFASNLLAGQDLQILSTLYRSNVNSGVVARTDRGIASVADLRGKTVAMAPNTSTDYMLSLMLTEVGLTDQDLVRLPLRPEEMADALAQGRVDAVATWSPHLDEAQARFPGGDVVILQTLLFSEMSILGVRGEAARTKAEALRRLLRALVRAEDFINENSDLALDIVIRHLGLTGRSANALRDDWPEYHHQARLDNFMLSALRQEAVWLASRDPTHPSIPDFRRRIDTEPLRLARPRAVIISGH